MTPPNAADPAGLAHQETHVFTEAELRRAVVLAPEGVAAIAEGFALLAAGRATQPPVLR